MKSAIKKEKGRVDLFGERYRARAHQLSPRLRAVVSYINDNREVVLEQTAMEIATATQTSDATVVRAIQALGFEMCIRDRRYTAPHRARWRADLREPDR